MSVTVRLLEDDSSWIAEVVSTENEDEKILIGANGRIALETDGFVGELWPGFVEEPEADYPDDED